MPGPNRCTSRASSPGRPRSLTASTSARRCTGTGRAGPRSCDGPCRRGPVLEAAGATLIQIDEPKFAHRDRHSAVGKQAVELIAGAVKIPTCMHVCGGLENVIDDILKINGRGAWISEFSKNPANLALFGSRDLAGRMDWLRLCGFKCRGGGAGCRDQKAD